MNTTSELSMNQLLDNATVSLVELSVDPKAVLLFSVYDTKTKEFGHPTCAQSAALVVASIMGHIRDQPSSPMAIRPRDFLLYHVGAWAPTTGVVFEMLETHPICVGNLAELIEHLTPDDIKSVLSSIDRLYNSIMEKK